MIKDKGFKVIENVNCNDKITLQSAVTKKVSRIISAELFTDSGKISFSQRHGIITYG
jgi:hypothetical protein